MILIMLADISWSWLNVYLLQAQHVLVNLHHIYILMTGFSACAPSALVHTAQPRLPDLEKYIPKPRIVLQYQRALHISHGIETLSYSDDIPESGERLITIED